MIHKFSSLYNLLFKYIDIIANKYVLVDNVMVGLSKYSPLVFVLILVFLLFWDSKNKKLFFKLC